MANEVLRLSGIGSPYAGSKGGTIIPAADACENDLTGWRRRLFDRRGTVTDDIMGVFAWRNLLTRPLRTMLALIGLSIPILGILGLFCLSNGLRDLVGTTLSRIEGLIILREDVPSPVFSRVPASLADELRKMPGVRAVAPEVWGLAPLIEGRGMLLKNAHVRQGNELDPGQAGDRRPGHRRASKPAECGVSAGAQGKRRGPVPPARRRRQAAGGDQPEDRQAASRRQGQPQEGRRHDLRSAANRSRSSASTRRAR